MTRTVFLSCFILSFRERLFNVSLVGDRTLSPKPVYRRHYTVSCDDVSLCAILFYPPVVEMNIHLGIKLLYFHSVPLISLSLSELDFVLLASKYMSLYAFFHLLVCSKGFLVEGVGGQVKNTCDSGCRLQIIYI